MSTTNSIVTSDIVVPFVAEYESNLPVLMNGSTMLNKKYVGGAGTTVSYNMPQQGGTTATGAATTPGNYTTAEVPVVLTQYNQSVELSAVDQALNLESFEDQIAIPYGAAMASDIQKIACDEILLKADTIKVIASGTGDFKDVGGCIAQLNTARGYGTRFGAMSSDLSNQVQNSAVAYFNPSTSLSNSWMIGGIGKFRNVEFYETADISALNTGTHALGSGTALQLNDTVATEGLTTITLKVVGGTATLAGTLVKGEAFTVAGYYAVDIRGNATSNLYQFIAQATATAGSNLLAVTVKPLYFAAGPLKNISVTTLTAGAVATFSHAASSTYLRGFVWTKSAFVFATGPMKPLSNTVSKSAMTPKGISLMCQAGADINAGTDIIRWDCLAGFKLVKTGFAARYDVKI
jgi:hypothetical protein